MQTTTTMAPGDRMYPAVGTRTKGHQPGSNHGKKSHQTVRKSTNDFLTASFKPIPVSEINPLYSEKNYLYLYDSARNYTDLLGVHLPVSPESRNFEELYKALQKLLPPDEDLTIRINKSRLQFIITENVDEHTLYYIPCCIIDRTKNNTLKDIYTSFFSIFQSSQGLTTLKEDIVWDFFLEELENESADEKDEWVSLLANYSTGPVGSVLDSIRRKPMYTIQELIQEIQRYKPETDKESLILDLMQEGLRLFRKDSIMRYARPPVEDDEEYYPVAMYRMMYIVYNLDDRVFDNLFEWICNEASDQGYEILSSGEIQLTPHTKKTFTHSTYIPQFLNWLNRFCYELHNL